IKKDSGRDLLIETVESVPADELERVQKDREARARFFDRWARERAGEAGVNGLYVLICRKPGRVEVSVGTETGKHDFLESDASRLRLRMAKDFGAKEYDKGLLDAVNSVRETLKANVHKGGGRAAVARHPDGGRGEGMGGNLGGLICTG